MSVLELARPEIRAMQPYSSARMEASGGQVFLNANESAWPPPGDDGLGCNRYPEPQPAALVATLAALYGVRHEQLLVGRGSDEAIDLLIRGFCRAGEDAILIQPPTFGMYGVCARIQNAAVIEVALADDFTLDVDAVLAAVTPAVKLIFVCTPNNPSGQCVPREDVERLLQQLDGRALLVVDEAYIEFAFERSVADLIDRYEGLAVLRTLSKAWALAGARIGCLLANPEVIALLRRIMPPYPLPLPCVAAAMAALSEAGQAQAREHLAVLRNEHERVRGTLAALPCVRGVLPSQANFLAVRFDDAGAIYQRLLAAGVVVRDVRRYPKLGDALRITIGTPAENDRMLAVLEGAATQGRDLSGGAA
ncbi:histidinol-phosphate transaminase [Rhodanobacter sp. Root179]|uniref:histidinol-phosphate transaminase n=1 Tax=unclassified Rhodanobacter TaxID=2621553 RepID=UPI0006FAA35A|nr:MULTISPECIES: histidinol-phosphate transaminase [unclassified Rhodanobacter]KQZ74593.1 histidinol-phosphate aminotransferase [Rhodanobacter sp. Root561]KRB33783.1 histidinol-phosphate aminotransferase [Rhodanobacter sp. Root179]